jgi:7,8-dihydropterin-6-yl-methyl-4-(beta-D-ribofuranosyl)aminobenzene 5'-phosphate synthase
MFLKHHFKNPETAVIHAGQEPDTLYGGVSVPIYQSSTFAFRSAEHGAALFAGEEKGFIYTRIGNPTTKALEDCVAALEGGYGALGTASGMAAVTTIYTAFLEKGAHVVSTASVYGPSRTILEKEYGRFGVEADFVDTSDLGAVQKGFAAVNEAVIHRNALQSDWGFSCFIEGTEKIILFDTGSRPEILMSNADFLKVDMKKVDIIVISHNHGDHTGGLSTILERNPDVMVYFPISFPSEFGRRIESLKAKIQTVDRPVEICRNVYLTGEMGDVIKEQSLIIDTTKGLIIVTGCSHQGIVNILKRAKEILDKPIYLVFGGFNLGNKSDAELQEIIANFKELKVEKCGATHCTGDKAIAKFKEAYGENYLPMGTGRVIEVSGF